MFFCLVYDSLYTVLVMKGRTGRYVWDILDQAAF